MILVDDDEGDRQLFEKAVKSLDLNIDLKLFNDGFALMDYIKLNHKHNPTIIFLDLNMPVKSGIEFLKELRTNNDYKDISIAIYSTSTSEKDIEETFLNGANVYITKPDTFNNLKRAIEKVLKINWQYSNSSLNRDNFLLRI